MCIILRCIILYHPDPLCGEEQNRKNEKKKPEEDNWEDASRGGGDVEGNEG
jgi:hypothetical protein